MAKVQISIDDGLLARIDDYADSNYMSRSGLITFATNQFLSTAQMVKAVTDMSVTMRKIADNNCVDDDTMHKLEDFERLAKLFAGK